VQEIQDGDASVRRCKMKSNNRNFNAVASDDLAAHRPARAVGVGVSPFLAAALSF
jgi:hypothetical protein